MAEIPEGQVKTEYLGGGWWLIKIGRARGTKRFNLHVNELRQILDQLGSQLP